MFEVDGDAQVVQLSVTYHIATRIALSRRVLIPRFKLQEFFTGQQGISPVASAYSSFTMFTMSLLYFTVGHGDG